MTPLASFLMLGIICYVIGIWVSAGIMYAIKAKRRNRGTR